MAVLPVSNFDIEISTHALREEGDSRAATAPRRSLNFYPRPPRGGRLSVSPGRSWASRFLPTPSARRATALIGEAENNGEFLPTPSARRATPC